MEITKLIEKYKITASGKLADGTRRIFASRQAERDGVSEEIRDRKAEILAELDRREEEKRREAQAAADAKRAKEDTIDGLREIENAIDAYVAYRRAFNAAIERGDCIYPREPKCKPADIERMKREHPRAAAYLKARDMAGKTNWELATIGEKACQRILDGEDYEAVLADMAAENTAFVNRHLWD